MSEEGIIPKIESYVFDLFNAPDARHLVYHDYVHTHQVAEAAEEIGRALELSEEDLEALIIAAWFHDVGYRKQKEGHEGVSAGIAESYLKDIGYPQDGIAKVVGCIEATKLHFEPRNLLEKAIKDADMLSLGSKIYSTRSQLLRLEESTLFDNQMTDEEWLEYEIEFLKSHRFFTHYAQLRYNESKAKNLLSRTEELSKIREKGRSQMEKKAKGGNPYPRGVETLFRTTIKNHMYLSSMADNKANLMLSINAIIISITISVSAPNLSGMSEMAIPVGFLLFVCLGSIVLATLATSPKFNTGQFTREDIQKKKVNLLFFGNFHNMDIDDYVWGVDKLMQDKDELYAAMMRDLHVLGGVLHRKYTFLRWTYQLFMYGIIASVILFGYFLAF